VNLITNRSTLFLVGLAMIVSSIACQKAAPGNSNANTAPASTPASTNAATPAQSAATPETTPATAGAFSLATPTDAYKTAYAARANKDIATLKRVLSKDVLAFFKDIAEIDKKSFDDQLMELTVKPQAATPDTRNEKITGNRATLEYLDEKGEWKVMDFSKEGSDWKLDLPKGP
jgi:hypothetical protein